MLSWLCDGRAIVRISRTASSVNLSAKKTDHNNKVIF